MIKTHNPKILLTFDVEGCDFFENKTEFSLLGCSYLLELLKKHNIKSTFFVTGQFAESHPETVRLIAKYKHEIASHGYNHNNLKKISTEALELDIRKSFEILYEITGEKIWGFRAPGCYINENILDTLIDLGFKYDSSVHPAIVPGHYYNHRHPLDPYWHSKGTLKLLEIPISVIPILRIPISWWWLRNLGSWITHLGTHLNLTKARDVILYFHAWEYTDLPKTIPYHIKKNCGKPFLKQLEAFITIYESRYSFDTLKELAKSYQ